MVDALADAIFWIRADGGFSYVNRQAARSLGYPRERLLQMRVSDIDPMFPQARWPAVWRDVKGRGALTLESLHRRADGQVFPVEVRVTYVSSEGQECLFAHVADITQRVAQTLNLQRMQYAVDNASDAVVWISRSGAINYANHTAARYLAYTREEICRLSIDDIRTDTEQPWSEHWRRAKESGELGFETEYLRSDGGACAVEVRNSFVDFKGQEMVFSTLRDVTARNQQYRELDEVRARLQTALTGARIGLWDWSVQDNQVYVSPELNAQLGEPPESWRSIEDFQSRLHPEDAEAANQRIEDFFQGLTPEYESIFRLRHVAGGYRWFLSRGQLFRDEDGSPLRLIGIHVDITERKQNEEALQRSNRELEKFAYVASHDLRSPLRGIANLASWIGEDSREAGVPLPAEVQSHLTLLEQQVARMEGLLTGLLEYSRAGRKRYEAEPIDLRALLLDVISMSGAGEGFEFRIPDRLSMIVTERSPLERVLLNLVSNAVKHHDRPEGCIEVTCEQEEASGFVRFTVSDDGPGIPDEHHDRIFEIYQTLRTKDQVEGSGMGLTIVKKLVEAAGGDICVAPYAGRGAAFIFNWPVPAAGVNLESTV